MLEEYVCISKDRACQLDLHIKCALEKFTQLNKIYILYTYSNPFFKQGYEKLINKNYPKIEWILESNFKNNLIDIVKNKIRGKYFLFLCDDHYFIDTFKDEELDTIFSNDDVHSVSIRLSETMTINSVTRHFMGTPNFTCKDKELLIWDWSKNNRRFDWGYPMAVGGTIFRKKDILSYLNKFEYKNSGQLEVKMNHNRMNYRYLMASFNKCCMVDLPFNNIIKEMHNPHGNIAVDFLNKEFLNGKTINTGTIYNIDTKDSFMTYDIKIIWDRDMTTL